MQSKERATLMLHHKQESIGHEPNPRSELLIPGKIVKMRDEGLKSREHDEMEADSRQTVKAR